MLSVEENELISRVGLGTPMGNLMREYWVPAMLSSEVVADGDPVRILLLGQRLIAFRDNTGAVGLLADACPHRGASLFFGRNEECGLRCVYHGWKFDVTGACVDMPNEPAESNFKHKVRATAYPCQERGGVVWTYMGGRGAPPPLPAIEANCAPDSSVRAFKQDCNWLQVLEGDIDTVHASFLHAGGVRPEDEPPGSFAEYRVRNRSARLQATDVDAGCAYGAEREGPPGMNYWRIGHFLMPFYSLAATGVLGVTKSTICRVPMDDYNTLSFFMNASLDQRERAVANRKDKNGGVFGNATPFATLPNRTDWLGRFRIPPTGENDFFIDRQAQRANRGVNGYSGIPGVTVQDAAMTWSMGPIYDRSKEHLGTSDTMVIEVRRRLIRAARALAELGEAPPGVDAPEAYAVRSGGIFLPKGADWFMATVELRKAFVDQADVDMAINGY
ncbi:MAG: Rieske 2Fe-2S domain-containing protein [Chloroflexota bacterium]